MSRPKSLESRVESALRDAGSTGISVLELRHTLSEDIERNVLRQVLKKLTRAGRAVRLERDLYAAPNTQADIVGRLRYRARQYIVEAEGKTWAISPKNLEDIVAGDVVRITPTGEQKRGRPRAVISGVVQPAPRTTFTLIKKTGRYLIGTAPAIDEPILIVDERAKAGGGDVQILGRAAHRKRAGGRLPFRPLMAELAIAKPDKNDAKADRRSNKDGKPGDEPARLTARDAFRYVRRDETNVEILLDQLARGVDVDALFSKEGLALAERAEEVGELRPGDVDLRDETLVTIDGQSAKDFDDAVTARTLEDGQVELLVAIADVSHYVTVDSALDVDAKQRGSSVYLPGRVYPMLPEQLSNHLCSLMPNVDRYCCWVRMRINAQGDVTWYDLGFGIMKSHARLTYTSVQEHLDGSSTIQDTDVSKAISALHEVYRRLHARRVTRGMLDFSLPESALTISDDGADIADISLVPRWDSHRLIEECMLATNETVADYLSSEEWPCIYRSHDEPDEEKLDAAFDFADGLGVHIVRSATRRTIDDISALVEALKGHPAERVANFMILRAMQKAAYTVSTKGHFGIGARRYAHFTSPIRRYADLEVHRVLREAIAIENLSAPSVRKLKTRLEQSARAANEGELRAVSAERYSKRLLKARYMADHVGEVYDTIVTGVQNFGLFVSISELDVEGLVRIATLPGRDYYVLNAREDALCGRRTGLEFRMGQMLRVRCAEVHISEGHINFEIEPESSASPDSPEMARDVDSMAPDDLIEPESSEPSETTPDFDRIGPDDL